MVAIELVEVRTGALRHRSSRIVAEEGFVSTVTRRKAILAILLVTAALIKPPASYSAVLNITIVRDARTIQAELMEPSAEPERSPRVETLWEDCRHFFALIRPGGDYAEERNTQNFLNQLPEVMELFNDLGHFDRSLDLAAMGAELTEEIPPAIRLREAHAHAGVGNLALIRGAEEDAAAQYRVAVDQLRSLGTRHFHLAEGIEALPQMIDARKTMDRLPVVYHYRMLNVYYAGLDTP